MLIAELMVKIYNKFGTRVSLSTTMTITEQGKKYVDYYLHWEKPFGTTQCEKFDSLEGLKLFVDLLMAVPSGREFQKAAEALA